jgi:hypothetical protein
MGFVTREGAVVREPPREIEFQYHTASLNGNLWDRDCVHAYYPMFTPYILLILKDISLK